MGMQRNRGVANKILKKKNKVGGVIWFQDLLCSCRNQAWGYWSDWHIDQWNRIENLELDPDKYSQLTCDWRTKAIHGGRVVFLTGDFNINP